MAGQTVLVTGGAGYIGSHCTVELLQAGYRVIALDNFVNSVAGGAGGAVGLPPSLERVQRITGRQLVFYECDLLDKQSLQRIFQEVSFKKKIYKSLALKIFFVTNYTTTVLFVSFNHF